MLYILQKIIPEWYYSERLEVHLNLLTIESVHHVSFDLDVVVTGKHIPTLLVDKLVVFMLAEVGFESDFEMSEFVGQIEGSVYDGFHDVFVQTW